MIVQRDSPEPPSIVLEGDLILDLPRAEDASAHRRFALDAEAARFFGWTIDDATAAPDSHYEEVVRRFIRDWESGMRFALAIRSRADGKAIGMVELRPRTSAEAAVSYMVAAEHRGQGVATRALAALLAWAARELSIRQAVLDCDLDNVASQRVAEKCGFVRVGCSGRDLRFVRTL
jgi:RimJ/RimL family protein N-acetyltransferase